MFASQNYHLLCLSRFLLLCFVEFFQHCFQLFLIRPCKLTDGIVVVVGNKGRYGRNGRGGGRIRIVVHVNLSEGHVRILLRHFLVHGLNRSARSTPRRRVVQDTLGVQLCVLFDRVQIGKGGDGGQETSRKYCCHARQSSGSQGGRHSSSGKNGRGYHVVGQSSGSSLRKDRWVGL